MKAAITSAIAIAILTVSLAGCADQSPAPSSATATTPPAPSSTPPAPSSTPPAPVAPTITDEDRAAISVAVSSRDTAALTPYLADPTNVILCASGGIGPRAPVDVVTDMDQRLASAALPWDFALPATTIDNYRAHAYGSYFPTDGLVARSADTQILTFSFTGARISTVFMCPDEGLVVE